MSDQEELLVSIDDRIDVKPYVFLSVRIIDKTRERMPRQNEKEKKKQNKKKKKHVVTHKNLKKIKVALPI